MPRGQLWLSSSPVEASWSVDASASGAATATVGATSARCPPGVDERAAPSVASIWRTLVSWAVMLSRRAVTAASSRSESRRIRSALLARSPDERGGLGAGLVEQTGGRRGRVLMGPVRLGGQRGRTVLDSGQRQLVLVHLGRELGRGLVAPGGQGRPKSAAAAAAWRAGSRRRPRPRRGEPRPHGRRRRGSHRPSGGRPRRSSSPPRRPLCGRPRHTGRPPPGWRWPLGRLGAMSSAAACAPERICAASSSARVSIEPIRDPRSAKVGLAALRWAASSSAIRLAWWRRCAPRPCWRHGGWRPDRASRSLLPGGLDRGGQLGDGVVDLARLVPRRTVRKAEVSVMAIGPSRFVGGRAGLG